MADSRGKGLLTLVVFLLTTGGAVAAQSSQVSVYGFFDLELEATNRTGGAAWTFDQHHFNVISIYRLDDHWRVFGEVEWEHGPAHEPGSITGEVVLERAILEYTRTDALRLKVGKFLAPFGLYNLRHDATPTFLSTSLPASVYGSHPNTLGGSQRLFSKFGTGIQALGSLVAAGDWEADYFVYLINGRGPEPAEQDDNQNKGIGGRLVIRAPGNVVQVGASYYADRNGEAANTRQRALAVDLTVQHRGFLLEAEGFVPRLERVDLAGLPNGTFQSARGYYAQVSYALAGGLTPFVRYDVYDPDTDIADNGERDLVAGLNLAAVAAVFFKAEVHARRFENPVQSAFQVFLASVAVAF